MEAVDEEAVIIDENDAVLYRNLDGNLNRHLVTTLSGWTKAYSLCVEKPYLVR